MKSVEEIKERIEKLERILEVEWDGKTSPYYSHLIGELRGLRWILRK